MTQLSFHSPVGALTLTEEEGAIVALDWGQAPDDFIAETPLLNAARAQVDAYFDGRLRAFDLPLRPAGTAFQLRVWQAMAAIPYGQVRRYGDLAGQLATGARAIGTACGRNPIPIIVPCHRVIGAHGGLGGYSGQDGVETKRFLLGLEGWTPGTEQQEHVP